MKQVPLLEVARLVADRVSEFEGVRPYIATGGLDDEERITPELVTFADKPSRADLAVAPGDVCFARMKATRKVMEFNKEHSALILSTGFAVLRPEANKLDSGYLRQWLNYAPTQSSKDKLCTGATQKAITNEKIAALVIPLPASLSEQRRTAAILDKADALRAKRRNAIAKLDQLLQSVATHTLTEDTLQTATVGDLLADGRLLLHKDGNHGAQYPRKEEFGDSGVPFLSAKDLLDDGSLDLTGIQRLKESKAKTLRIGWIEKGDVLLAHNASVGKVALYRGEFGRALIGTSLTAFRADPYRIRPEFLFMCMRLPQFQSDLVKDMSQTTRNQVPITAQRRLMIPVPRTEIQDKILRAVEIVQRHKNVCVAQMESLNAMMTSLQGAAFSGGL